MMTPQKLTLLLAIWGSVTGTVAILLQLLHHRADRADLRITAHLTNSVDIHHPVARLVFSIEAVNHGRRVVNIRKAGIELPPDPGPLPEGVFTQTSYVSIFDSEMAGRGIELGEGAHYVLSSDPFPAETAKKLGARATAFVEDSRGRRYTAEFFTIRPTT